MAKLFNDNRSKRVIFPVGEQKLFLQRTMRILEYNNTQLAKLCNIHIRTLTDWKREKFSLPETAVKKISEKANIPIPENLDVRPAFWSTKKAAKLGAQATIRKYGAICTDPEKRRQGWYRWWQDIGQFRQNLISQPKDIKQPLKNVRLAEFVGIIMGDGGITEYQVTITLNRFDDLEYSEFVIRLIKNLFEIDASRNFRESVVNIQISRKNLVKFCQSIGLKKGNKIKQQIDIPNWVKVNREYSIACVRGLIDTDGTVYKHRYKVGNKVYCYKKIGFTSKSVVLIKSVKRILESLGLHPKIDCKGDIKLYSIKEVKTYFHVIGSSNQKHINKIKAYFGEGARRPRQRFAKPYTG